MLCQCHMRVVQGCTAKERSHWRENKYKRRIDLRKHNRPVISTFPQHPPFNVCGHHCPFQPQFFQTPCAVQRF